MLLPLHLGDQFLFFLLFGFMNHNGPSADSRGRIGIVYLFYLVVVDDSITAVLIPDLNSKQCNISAWRQLLINRREHKAIIPRAVDRTVSFGKAKGRL